MWEVLFLSKNVDAWGLVIVPVIARRPEMWSCGYGYDI